LTQERSLVKLRESSQCRTRQAKVDAQVPRHGRAAAALV
jgi:hypothetical protein